ARLRSDAQWAEIIAAHPVLLQRPILVSKNKAVIARPLENMIDLLEN
ncbi:MAG: ArsC/Spx/MgsR family protein, partial [Francisellaceae bacterium]